MGEGGILLTWDGQLACRVLFSGVSDGGRHGDHGKVEVSDPRRPCQQVPRCRS